MGPSNKSKASKFNAKGLADSFRNAFSGFKVLIGSGNNARIHIIILSLVIIAAIVLKIAPAHWIAISLAAGLVMASECFNTAVEYLCDIVMPEYDSRIKKAKDIAAAGVLISAVISVVIGLIVFIPSIIRLFGA
jgi:diacylglycerol kinase (ATP)